MYNGIGLQTPRGSGTNGYIQTNKFFVRPKTGQVAQTTKGFDAEGGTAGITKKPNKDILDHDRKRQIEVKLLVLQDTLEEQGFDAIEITQRISEARQSLNEAAAAAEEPIGVDTKISETQSHQIAARKEKQMETLRAALGIDKDTEQIDEADEEDDGPRSRRKNGPKEGSKWAEKPEHAFLDRDYSRRKKNVEESLVEKDDKRGSKAVKKKRDGVDESRQYKDGGKTRRHRDDPFDSDGSEERDVERRKKHYGSRRMSNYDSDTDSGRDKKKKKTLERLRKGRRHDTDDDEASSEEDTDSDNGKRKSRTSMKHIRSRRHDNDSDDPDFDNAKKTIVPEKPKRGIKHDSDSEETASDDSDIGKKRSKTLEKRDRSRKHGSESDDSAPIDTHKDVKLTSNKEFEKHEKSYHRNNAHDSRDDSNSELDLSKHRSSESIHRRWHDSEESDADEEMDRKRSLEKKQSVPDNKSRRSTSKKEVERYKKSSRRHDDTDDSEDDSDSEVDLLNRKTSGSNGPSKRRRYDSEDESDTDEEMLRKRSPAKKQSKQNSESRRIETNSYRGRSTHDNEDSAGHKRKFTTDGEDEEETYVDDHSRSLGRKGHKDEIVERGGRVEKKNSEARHGNRTGTRVPQDEGGEKRHMRDEENRRESRHERDEYDDRYRRSGRDDQQYGSRWRERVEEERGNGHERDKQRERGYDEAKRSRYDDDSRSSQKRRYENEKHDDDRRRY